VTAAAGLGMTVLRLYGSTEVLVATWNRPESPAELREATDGTPLDGVELEVRDEEGKPLIDTPGEIFVRGPACTVGFLRDPERTQATIDPEGWVASGDLGVLSADRYLTIVGRKKEIIIRGGMNIAPREIEDVIAKLPGVEAVAVVGLPHERLGEIGCACVVLADGVTMDLPGLVAALREFGLASYKLPERLEVLDALPRTASGKVQKHRIIEALLG
jgi:acyl-CoA synthetase (AMP-forming)/AMP-acid ligase II